MLAEIVTRGPNEGNMTAELNQMRQTRGPGSSWFGMLLFSRRWLSLLACAAEEQD